MVRQPHPAAGVGAHRGHLCPARAERIGDRADDVGGAVDDAVLDGLDTLTVDLLGDDRGSRHLELVALAAHRLDEDREVQLAASAHVEDVGGRSVLDAQRDVGEQLALADAPAAVVTCC